MTLWITIPAGLFMMALGIALEVALHFSQKNQGEWRFRRRAHQRVLIHDVSRRVQQDSASQKATSSSSRRSNSSL